jgi:hypothetical protein
MLLVYWPYNLSKLEHIGYHHVYVRHFHVPFGHKHFV